MTMLKGLGVRTFSCAFPVSREAVKYGLKSIHVMSVRYGDSLG